jgi:colanic acid biosynthesis glycosyl transferase WcaI
LRALLYSMNYAPELTGIGKYTGEMAEWLAARGFDVTVVTTPPYYPAWRVDAPYSSRRYRRETIRGVKVIRCPLWVPRRVTGLKRILHLASFAVTSLPVILWSALRLRPSLIFVVEPPLFAAPAALLAARLSGAKAWLHVQDLEIDAAFELGVLKRGALQKAALKFESWLMRKFDRVSAISERMLARVARKGVAAGRTVVFPNWVELDRIRPLPEANELRSQHFGNDPVVVLYSGNMGMKQGFETVVQAAAMLAESSDDMIRFVFCGDGVGRETLETAAKALKNITLLPLVPADRLNELLNAADIHVLPQRAGSEDLVFPSKLTNMLASGRPVVAASNPNGQVATLFADADCGIVVPPGDAGGLAEALRSLASDAARRRTLGAAGRKAAERLWDKDAVLASAFEEQIGSLMAREAQAEWQVSEPQRARVG